MCGIVSRDHEDTKHPKTHEETILYKHGLLRVSFAISGLRDQGSSVGAAEAPVNGRE
jgi:hypothetical protein